MSKPVRWNGTDGWGKDKNGKKVEIFYAAPEPYKYGFFASTIKSVRDAYLKERNAKECSSVE